MSTGRYEEHLYAHPDILGWYKGLPHKSSLACATRAALRAIPLMSTLRHDEKSEHADIELLAGLRATITTSSIAQDPSSLSKMVAVSAETMVLPVAKRLYASAEGTSETVRGYSFYAAAYSVQCFDKEIAVARCAEAAGAITAAYSLAGFRKGMESNFAETGQTIREHLKIESSERANSLLSKPLNLPDEILRLLQGTNASFQTLLSDSFRWSFWREWYQGFLDGQPLDGELQRRVAMIPDPIWDAGPQLVAEEIEKIRALFELEKRIEELEAERAAAETRQDRTGIGGNSPPEPIEDEAEIVEQVTIVWATIGELKDEAKKEEPDKAVFARVIEILMVGLAKIRAFIAKAGAHTALLVYGAAVSSGTTALIQKPELLEAVIEAAKTALPFLH